MARTAALLLAALTAFAQSEYAGSKACAGCHRKLYDDYTKTAMGRSMTAANTMPGIPLDKPVKIHDARLDRHYEVFTKDGGLYQSESQRSGGEEVFKTTHKIEYAIGSGVNGVSFAVRRGRHLFQAPLSYYSRRGEWGLSPGFELADYGFSRPIHAACIACHSGRPRPVAGREAQYADPPFDELAIGCENCHGPGRDHALRRKSIVNPAKLTARLAEDICMNCHQTGDTRVVQPGRQITDFRPGQPLHQTVAIFRLASVAADSDLLEHHEAMKSSLCFTASAGSLSCLTCHNPHRMPTAAEKVAFYRRRCESCHTASNTCRLPQAQRRGKGNDCAGCHMPKRAVREISHSSLTSHRIAARPRFTAGTPDAELPGLIYLNRPAKFLLPILTRLTAYGELLGRDPALTPHYLEALEKAAGELPSNPLVLSALGRKALREGQAEALELIQRAVSEGATASPVYLDLAEALAKRDRNPEAIVALRDGLALEPFCRELRKSLILRLINTRHYDAARAEMRAYLETFPEDSFMRGLLAKVDR